MNHDGKVSKTDNIDQTMTTFRAAMARMDANPGEAARIRNLANATDAQMAAEAESETLRRPRAYAARTYGELIALTADVQAKAARIEETSGRARPWWLPRDWLAMGVFGAVLAAVALVAALPFPVIVIFLVGALLGVLIGGALCVRYLRREVVGDIGPKLKRMQLQLDNMETELNLAIATRHAELSADPSDLPRQRPQRHEPRPLWR
jgi:hypothetical protein